MAYGDRGADELMDPLLVRDMRQSIEGCVGSGSLLSLALFGSQARGGAEDLSDIDVLVVLAEGADSLSQRRRLRRCTRERDRAVSLSIFTPDELRLERIDRPSFVAHLAHECVVLYESGRWSGLDAALAPIPDPDCFRREAVERSEDLEQFANLEPFRGQFVVYAADLYALTKSIVIAKLLAAGCMQYDWRTVFERYGHIRPERRSDLEVIAGLRPYYERVRADREVAVLEPPTASDARRAWRAASRIAAS